MYLIAEDSRTCYSKRVVVVQKKGGTSCVPDSYMLLGVTLWCWSTDYCEWDQFAALKYGWVAVQTEVSVPPPLPANLDHWESHISSAFCFFLSGVASTLLYNFLQQRLLSCSDFFTSLVVLDCLLASKRFETTSLGFVRRLVLETTRD